MSQLKQEIDQLLGDLERLPSFPDIVHKVLQMVRDPDADFQAVAKEISKDLGLTSDILRISNSAYYHPSREIRSVHEAIVILGLKTVKDIVMVSAARGILKQPVTGYRLEERDMWDHCIVVASLASKIAEDRKTKTPADVAFTAGLLHDVGKVVLSQVFRKAYVQISMETKQNPNQRFTELEKKYMGYNHSEVGAILLKKWNFPSELVEAALYNYTPEKAKMNPELTNLIHVANWITLSAGIGVDAGGLSEHLSTDAVAALGLTDANIRAYYEDLPELLESLKELRDI
ncbi:MAG: HDOD domain-containing protein [Leptonema illini]|jgi:putative nucleotidyltransferase with HDIG domain|uniref:Metal dependent phosphohydrolase n=2 Tax=Leptonema illini TaxID=183 RepID=H2CLE9_9LEPT|nr:HDOD domain-containing protein [Leptonema illini]EHQ04560.1 metal dependent phosphohydrolase [Leptonema illini DSM 21528]KAB2932721.1 MAG: HDOD domain-containing protein [Leptonema illini]PKL33013.1 MAG: HDOD domain-containing protein [Spirochaetae bacterium HGW-Spirochaetae-10]